MKAFLGQLLARPDVEPREPAAPVDIDGVAQAYDVPLPPVLLELWLAADGVGLRPLGAHLMGPAEILASIAPDAWGAWLLAEGCLPLVGDDHQSNLLVLYLGGPLAGRVAAVPHDGDRRLRFNGLESCLGALMAAMNDGADALEALLEEVPGDYAPDAPRTAADRDAARALLRAPNEHGKWNLAVQLLDGHDLPAWAQLLESEASVRRDARERLRQLSHEPAVRALVRQDQQAFAAFAVQVVAAAGQAGLSVGERRDTVWRIGGKWIDLETFFFRRHIPDALSRLTAWLGDLAAGRDPRVRERAFMVDD